MEAIIEALHSSDMERLDVLSAHQDPQVRRAAASNDSTSSQSLAKLMRDDDRQVRMTAISTVERHALAKALRG